MWMIPSSLWTCLDDDRHDRLWVGWNGLLNEMSFLLIQAALNHSQTTVKSWHGLFYTFVEQTKTQFFGGTLRLRHQNWRCLVQLDMFQRFSLRGDPSLKRLRKLRTIAAVDKAAQNGQTPQGFAGLMGRCIDFDRFCKVLINATFLGGCFKSLKHFTILGVNLSHKSRFADFG